MSTCQWCKRVRACHVLSVKFSLAVIAICPECLAGNEEFFEVIK